MSACLQLEHATLERELPINQALALVKPFLSREQLHQITCNLVKQDASVIDALLSLAEIIEAMPAQREEEQIAYLRYTLDGGQRFYITHKDEFNIGIARQIIDGTEFPPTSVQVLTGFKAELDLGFVPMPIAFLLDD